MRSLLQRQPSGVQVWASLLVVAMSLPGRQRSRSPLPVGYGEFFIAADGLAVGGSAAGVNGDHSTVHARDGSPAPSLFADTSSDCSISELRFDSTCSSDCGSSGIDAVGPSVPGWDSPWSSPRAPDHLLSDAPAEAGGQSAEVPGHGTLCDAAFFSCIGSRSHGSLSLLRQHSLCRCCGDFSGVRNLGRQLSDSELPQNCLDGKLVSSSVVDIAAAPGSHAP